MKNAEQIKQEAEYYENLILNQIAIFINNKRKEKGITVRDLNKITGVSIGVISDLENHNSMPRIETLIRICEALDIDINVLFENMKLAPSTLRKGTRTNTQKINKYDKLGQLLAGFENSEYTKEDIAEIISYAKYIDFKKQDK